MSTRLTRRWLLELNLNSGSLWILAAWNGWHRIHFRKVSRCSLLPPLASARRHSWRLQGVLGFTCSARRALWATCIWWTFHFPGENLQGYDQVSPNVTLARWYCTWTKILAFMLPWELLSITVDACLMITTEGFSLISHLEDGWSHKSLMILIFMNSHITFVDFDFPWPVKTFRLTLTRLRSSGRYFPKV